MSELDAVRKRIISSIDSCKAFDTYDARLMIFAYQQVLRWIAKIEKQGK
jgi:hypothetical protein